MRNDDLEIFSAPSYDSSEDAQHAEGLDPDLGPGLVYYERRRHSPGPRCCTPRHCCNLKCLFQHIGTSGYSLENAAVYANAAYKIMLAAGWVRTMPGLVASVIAVILVTGWVTLGNYKSYLAIMDRFLSTIPLFSDEQKDEIMCSLERGLEEVAEDPSKRFWVIVAVVAAILKAGISIYPLYLIIYGVIHWVSSIESSWPSGCIVFLIAILNLFATVAFFNQGNTRNRTAAQNVSEDSDDEDFEFDEEDVELQRLGPRVIMRSTAPGFSDIEEDPATQQVLVPVVTNAARSQSAGCCLPGCCCNTYCVLQHSGAGGYSTQNAALYSNSGYQIMSSRGWTISSPTLSYTGLVLGTVSVTAANYRSYLAIMDNFLVNFLGFPRVSSNLCDNSCTRGMWLVNTVFATGYKVGVSAFILFDLCNMIFYDHFGVWPAATFTGVISAANIVATVGFFRQEVALTARRRSADSQRVELLPDQSDGSSDNDNKIQLDVSRLY